MSRRRIGFWYRFIAVLLKPPLVVLFKRKWRGMEHIPREGGFIAVVNHNSYLDPLSYAHFQYNAGRPPRFLAKDALFKGRVMGAFLRGTGQIPVYRGTTDAADAFRAAVDAVNSGGCVQFYPEGTLTRDPDLWPMAGGKSGAARVALETRAPVIPIAQWGAHEALPPYGKLHLFPRKTLRVLAGPPVDLSAYYGKEPTSAVLREVTGVIMDAVTRLLGELRGEEPPAERFDPRRARGDRAAKKKAAEEQAADEPTAGGGSGHEDTTGKGAGDGAGTARAENAQTPGKPAEEPARSRAEESEETR